ncbi:hypothetical protein [Nostoc sp. LEGE 12450]|uniref:hypothetical protein n=1 Tax=Nostoc sp. LEGE 12450 TaxID=1828643 RepID=UPI00188036ED|nr:hypothetical protein [Nostoc sp. LEGE 12450]MBE8990524.1 hypothetical protein [Nostoc sp. LEGE 12450]
MSLFLRILRLLVKYVCGFREGIENLGNASRTSQKGVLGVNYGDRNLRQPSHKSKKLLNEYQRLINGVQSLFNEAQRLINGVQNLFNEYQRLINGVQRLVDKST